MDWVDLALLCVWGPGGGDTITEKEIIARVHHRTLTIPMPFLGSPFQISFHKQAVWNTILPLSLFPALALTRPLPPVYLSLCSYISLSPLSEVEMVNLCK